MIQHCNLGGHNELIRTKSILIFGLFVWHVTLFLYNFHVFEMYMFVTNVRHNSWWKTLKFWNVHHIICQCQCLLQSLGPLIVFVTCLMITFKIKRCDKCNSWILCVPPSIMFVTNACHSFYLSKKIELFQKLW